MPLWVWWARALLVLLARREAIPAAAEPSDPVGRVAGGAWGSACVPARALLARVGVAEACELLERPLWVVVVPLVPPVPAVA